jgi:hypothetical protein
MTLEAPEGRLVVMGAITARARLETDGSLTG